MGILRTDKVSGLEKPTAVTGSVAFDGNDHLSIGSAGDFNFLHNGATDWTVEFWTKIPSNSRQFVFGTGASSAQIGFSLEVMTSADGQSATQGVFAMYGRGAAGNYRYFGANNVLLLNTWHHIAAVFKTSDKTLTIYVDGREVVSSTGTASGSFGTGDYSSSNSSYAFTVAKNIHGSSYLTGDISNLRVVAGRRLYTSNFTPPVHALEPIDGTRILCCNNPDSVTAVSNTDIGKGYTATASGDPTVSTDNPGLTRDFTSGTEFQGVTIFDTQGYFVPPSGTTEQRGRGVGLYGGGNSPGVNPTAQIASILIQSMGNSVDWGDLSVARYTSSGTGASATRGIWAGGATPTRLNTIDFVTIATTGNAQDFGDTQNVIFYSAGASNSIRMVNAGGDTPTIINVMDLITIASIGNAQDFGDLTVARVGLAQGASPTRGVFAGGWTAVPAYTPSDVIDYVTIVTTGNATDFGNLSAARRSGCGGSSQTRAIFMGGITGSAPSATEVNTIDYVTIASTGNAVDFGDMTAAVRDKGNMMSNSIRCVGAGGYDSPATVNSIDMVTIATTGNAVDFGDTITPVYSSSGLSDSHGGIS